MNKHLKHLLLLLTVLNLQACMSFASLDSLPQDSQEVSFKLGGEGKIGEARYSSIKSFSFEPGIAYQYAKAALTENGFRVMMSDKENLTILGEHGMTPYDWNVVAGVYIKNLQNSDSIIRLIVQGSKGRVRVRGDVTGSNWTKDIFESLEQYEKIYQKTSKNN